VHWTPPIPSSVISTVSLASTVRADTVTRVASACLRALVITSAAKK
jgi:hypothetical protein